MKNFKEDKIQSQKGHTSERTELLKHFRKRVELKHFSEDRRNERTSQKTEYSPTKGTSQKEKNS
jgi:hypothetical protein